MKKISRKIAKKLMLTAVVFTTSLLSYGNAADTFITFGTGGITGAYYPIGGAICKLVNSDRKTHGIRCTVESTGASVFNLNAIKSGNLDLGFAQSDSQYYALKGEDKFKEQGPNPELRALFALHAEPFTLVARADSAVKTFADIKGKRVNLGDAGSGTRSTMELLMKQYGWTNKDFKIATDLKPAEMASAMCDNKIDVISYVVGHPNAAIKEATTTCESHIIPIVGAEVDKLSAEFPFYPKAIIPAGIYKGTDTAIETFGPRATIVTSSKLSDEAAYLIVKSVFENMDEFKKMHPALESLTKEEMLTGNTAPFHPGAIKYFKEKGLMK